MPLEVLDTIHYLSFHFAIPNLCELIERYRIRRMLIDAARTFRQVARSGDVPAMVSTLGSLKAQHSPLDLVEAVWQAQEPFCLLLKSIVRDLEERASNMKGEAYSWEEIAYIFEHQAKQLLEDMVGGSYVLVDHETAALAEEEFVAGTKGSAGWVAKLKKTLFTPKKHARRNGKDIWE